MKSYLDLISYLQEQFKAARGITGMSILDERMRLEFERWTMDTTKDNAIYVLLLQHLGIEVESPLTFEVGKSTFDSSFYAIEGLETTILTPFVGVPMLDYSKNKVITGELIISDDQTKDPMLEIEREHGQCNTIITQNPYSQLSVRRWEDLLSDRFRTTVLGVFGDVKDADRKSKVDFLLKFRGLLEEPVIEEHVTVRDSYASVIITKPKILKLNLLKTRSGITR